MQVLNVLGAAFLAIVPACGGAMVARAASKVGEFHTPSDNDKYGNIFTAGIIMILLAGGVGYELLSQVNP